MATHSSILAGRIPWTEEPGRLQSMGFQRVGHNIQKMKIMASGPITSWEIDAETVETVSDFIFWGLQNNCRW